MYSSINLGGLILRGLARPAWLCRGESARRRHRPSCWASPVATPALLAAHRRDHRLQQIGQSDQSWMAGHWRRWVRGTAGSLSTGRSVRPLTQDRPGHSWPLLSMRFPTFPLRSSGISAHRQRSCPLTLISTLHRHTPCQRVRPACRAHGSTGMGVTERCEGRRAGPLQLGAESDDIHFFPAPRALRSIGARLQPGSHHRQRGFQGMRGRPAACR